MTVLTVSESNTISCRCGAWGAVFAMTLCVSALIASEFMPVSLLTPLASDLHLTAGQAGQAISVSGIFAVVMSLLVSRATRGIDRRTVLLAFTLLMIASGTVAFAPNFAVLMAGRALLGIWIGGFIITAGTGLVQRWGDEVQEIHPGDVVWIPPGQKHWHGASPTTAMTHIAIQEELAGKNVEWMEPVTDEQYRK